MSITKLLARYIQLPFSSPSITHITLHVLFQHRFHVRMLKVEILYQLCHKIFNSQRRDFLLEWLTYFSRWWGRCNCTTFFILLKVGNLIVPLVNNIPEKWVAKSVRNEVTLLQYFTLHVWEMMFCLLCPWPHQTQLPCKQLFSASVWGKLIYLYLSRGSTGHTLSSQTDDMSDAETVYTCAMVML